MTATEPGTQSPAPQGFRHDLLLYSGPEQFVHHAAAFARDAMERDQSILAAVVEPHRELLCRELGQDAKRVDFLDPDGFGRNPARIIPVWQQWVQHHHDLGREVRGIHEPALHEHSPQTLIEYQIHERLLETAFGQGPAWWLLCPYDTESLPEPVIARANQTHPAALLPDSAAEAMFVEVFGSPLPVPEAGELMFESDFGVNELSDIRDAVQACAGVLGQRSEDLMLVSSELATNSIRHGGGRGTLRLWRERGDVVCEVRDQGVMTDVLIGRRRPDLRFPGGAGLWIVNQLCDLVQIRSAAESGTVIRARMALG